MLLSHGSKPWFDFGDVDGLQLLGDPCEDGVVVLQLPAVKRWSKISALGCVNLFPVARRSRNAESRNLEPIFLTVPVDGGGDAVLEVDERGQHLQPVLVERLGVRAAHELDGLRLEVVVDRLQFLEDLLHVLVVLVVEED